jgi:hypothetical protein
VVAHAPHDFVGVPQRVGRGVQQVVVVLGRGRLAQADATPMAVAIAVAPQAIAGPPLETGWAIATAGGGVAGPNTGTLRCTGVDGVRGGSHTKPGDALGAGTGGAIGMDVPGVTRARGVDVARPVPRAMVGAGCFDRGCCRQVQ